MSHSRYPIFVEINCEKMALGAKAITIADKTPLLYGIK